MRLRSTLAVAAFAAAVLPGVASAQQHEPFPGLDTYIATAVKTWKIPGIGVAIVRNDSVLFTKGYGTLAVNSTTPVNDQTLFEIGSSSKAFTATLVAMLVSDGKMHFDDRITQYLPDFRMYDPLASAEVTMRDALTHRSGIARGELVWLGSGATRAEVLHRVRFLKPESPFRSRWSYQNMMFLAAGEAAAKAAGTTWEDLVQKRIFTPLGMTASVPIGKGLSNPNVAKPHGMDHDTAFVKPPFDAMNIAPAGSILSSARDMAQWLRFQLGDGMFNGTRLVASAALRETHTPQMLMGAGAGGGGGRGRGNEAVPQTVFSTYGMGWMVEDHRRNLVWQHGGNTPGMTAAVGMMPERKFGVVVLSNMQSAQLPEIIMRYIFDREIGAPMRDLSGEAFTRFAAQRKAADSMQVVQAGQRSKGEPPVPLSAFAGTYVDSLYGEATVSLVNGHLDLKRGDWHGPLEFWNATNFRWDNGPGSVTGPMNIKFEIAPDGKVTGLYFGIQGDLDLMNRKAPPGGRGGRGGGGGAGGQP
jgi:CubicO group peptidase (beta-lactamase class C family)